MSGALLANESVYTYVAAPTILSIQPAWGLLEVRTNITVTGMSFVNSTKLSCRFGSIKVPATYLNQSSIACSSPKHTVASTVSLAVLINGQDATLGNTKFEYRRGASISVISPSVGSSGGGTEIVVIGSRFAQWSNGVSCVFGNASTVPAIWVSATRATCISPPSITGPGHTQFRMQSVDGMFLSSVDVIFSYLPSLAVTSFSPVFASTGVTRTAITIFGSGFHFSSILQCRFGSTPVFATFVNQSVIKCLTPFQMSAKVVALGVSNDGTSVIFASRAFRFVPNPTIVGVAPTSASYSMRSSVIVRGAQLPSNASSVYTCKFGTLPPTTCDYLNASALSCNLPQVPSQFRSHDLRVQVWISLNGNVLKTTGHYVHI